MIDHHMPISQKTRSGLLVALAELVENVHRHGASAKSAFACAQVYPRRNKLTICIVDTGIGIRQSFLAGQNAAAKDRIKRGESPVKLATSPLVTSKPGQHSGYGLYVVSELAVRNGGTFRIFSGNEVLTLYRRGWTRREYHAVVPQGWQGTWIAILLDLDSLLPIGDVYSTLPPAEGAEAEDYF
jgi:anti-sigma regulatory factor (Ser/Thr protein kinase)